MKLLFCFLFLVALVNSKTLSFTKLSLNIFGEHKLEEPEYKVLPNPVDGSSFEIREYMAANWVVNSFNSSSIDGKMGTEFMKLFNYINAGNHQDEHIPMTKPVLNKVGSRACVMCDLPMAMMFYVPTEFQDNVPTPIDSSLEINKMNTTTFYVRKFGGRAYEGDWRHEASLLREELVKNGITDFNMEQFHFAAYNSPMDIFNRRNEVWFTKM